jgi:hypothetical protein
MEDRSMNHYRGINSWEEAINYVLLTNRNYIHDLLTIETRDGQRSIAVLTDGKTNRSSPDEALIFLRQFTF